jgi:proline iminopeptidase
MRFSTAIRPALIGNFALLMLMLTLILGGCVSGRIYDTGSDVPVDRLGLQTDTADYDTNHNRSLHGTSAHDAKITLPIRDGMLSVGWMATDASNPASFRETTESDPQAIPIQLYYRIAGDAPDTLVILNGGSGMSYTYLYHDLLPLTARFTLVFYDQRSSGRSTLVPDIALNATSYATSDLEALRRHLGLTRMTLLGHSWGVLQAALYANEYPDRVKSMIMVAGVGPAWAVYGPNFNTWVSTAPDLQPTLGALYEQWQDGSGDPLKACQDYWQVHLRAFYENPTQARRAWGNVCNAPNETVRTPWGFVPYAMLMQAEFDYRTEFSQISAPTLIIHGLADPMPLAAAEAWGSTLPDARIIRIPRAGHAPYVDSPHIFFPTVTAFATEFSETTSPATSTYQQLLDTLRTVNDQLEKAILRQDWVSAAEVFADEAVMLVPGGGPVWGKTAIASYWRAGYGKGLRSIELETVEAERHGDFVLEIGKYAIFGDQDLLVDAGKYQVFWRLTPDGWRIWRDTFNSSLETRSPLEIPDYLPPQFLRH